MLGSSSLHLSCCSSSLFPPPYFIQVQRRKNLCLAPCLVVCHVNPTANVNVKKPAKTTLIGGSRGSRVAVGRHKMQTQWWPITNQNSDLVVVVCGK